MAYGWTSFDMEELEGQEAANGRAGIIQIHNIDLRDRVLPLSERGTVYVGVFQER